jgi:nicotinamide mononucleotide transporter
MSKGCLYYWQPFIFKFMQINKSTIIEAAAVLLNLLFTWLYAQDNSWCFLVGVLSPLLFIYLTYQRQIYADMMLQVFYIGTTIWGYTQFNGHWSAKTLNPAYHWALIGGSLLLAGFIGRWLKAKTDAALPTLDSFITLQAMIGTVLMMVPVHASWLYLLVANVLSLTLYLSRGLYLSVGMFIIYIAMCIDAYWSLGWIS